MDLTDVIEMDKDEAAQRAYEYREIKVPTDEDKRILAIFSALAAGKQVIDLHRAIRDAGRDDDGHPRLAAAPVYRDWCYLYDGRGYASFRTTNTGRPNSETITVKDFPDGSNDGSQWSVFRSQVPMVPPIHRKFGSRRWTILWEVEEWAKAPRPPGDPILLKPLLGSLYTVEAVWDLTEVERLVLGQRP